VKVSAELRDNEFIQNGAEEFGGALHTDSAYMDLAKEEFNANQAGELGGAIYNDNSDLQVNRAQFLDNESDLRGGAIFTQRGKFKVSNTLFTGNTASILGSVVQVGSTPTAFLRNCTISLNGNFPISAIQYSQLKLYNNIIVSNSVMETVSDLDILSDTNSNIDARYNICSLEGNENITGTIDIFRDPFEAAHPQAAVVYGSVAGETDPTTNVVYQLVQYGDAADLSLITVTAVDGWEFDAWETLDHTVISDFSNITGNMKLYAKYVPRYVAVTYSYDPSKLCVSSGQGTYEQVDASTRYFVTMVQQYYTPDKPDMEGVNGWVFDSWDSYPDAVDEDCIITAEARPTVSYNFGLKGYYKDGSKQSLITREEYSPLFEPDDAKIHSYAGYEFVGWSDTEGGSVIALPASITEPTTYYAVYEEIDISFTVNAGLHGNNLSIDPTGTYEYGTRLDLSDSEVLTLIPDSGYYLIGFEDTNGDSVSLSRFILQDDETITAQYAAVPTGSLTVFSGFDGVINPDEASQQEFAIIDRNASKNVPDGDESLLGLIIPLNYTKFTGYTPVIENSNLILTANYTTSYYEFIMEIITGNQGPFFANSSPAIMTLACLEISDVSLFNGNDFSTYLDIYSENPVLAQADDQTLLSMGFFEAGDVIDLSTIDVPVIPGYRFVGWFDASGNEITSLTLNSDQEVQAVYEEILYTLDVEIQGEGSVDTNLAGDYSESEVIELTDAMIVADTGYTFIGWIDESGDTVSSVTMDADITLTAVFTADQHTLTLLSAGSGTIDSSYQGEYDYGTDIDLDDIDTAPEDGWELVEWVDEHGDDIDSVTIDGDREITAVFERISYSLSVDIEGNGTVDDSLPGTYDAGETVVLYASLAVPEDEYQFAGYEDEQGNILTSITIDDSYEITAVFTVKQYPLTIIAEHAEQMSVDNIIMYDYGTVVDLSSIQVIAEAGYVFTGWEDESQNIINSVNMDLNRTVYAIFALDGVVVSPPTAETRGGTVAAGTTVALSCATVGAMIFYTTDGGTPGKTSTLYIEPITINESITLKAIAVRDEMQSSGIMEEIYTIKNSNDDNDGNGSDRTQNSEYGMFTINAGNMTAEIDSNKLALFLQNGGDNPIVWIAIEDTNVNALLLPLTLADIQQINDYNAQLEIITPYGIYNMPADGIDFASIAAQYPDHDLKDIQVTIQFDKVDIQIQNQPGISPVGQPVSIKIEITIDGNNNRWKSNTA